MVDAQGITLGMIVAPADRHDSPLLGEILDASLKAPTELPDMLVASTSAAPTTQNLTGEPLSRGPWPGGIVPGHAPSGPAEGPVRVFRESPVKLTMVQGPSTRRLCRCWA